MGYDMYVCDEQANTVDQARVPEYDPNDEASIEAAFRAQDEAHCYLRRNIWGMGPLRDLLVMHGMAYHAANPPAWEDFPDRIGDEHFDDNYEPVTEEGQLYAKRVMKILRDTGDERPGIPVHKLSDNSGWWVTKAECVSALQMWERAGCPQHDEIFRDDVIPFLRQAAAHGGFRVY